MFITLLIYMLLYFLYVEVGVRVGPLGGGSNKPQYA